MVDKTIKELRKNYAIHLEVELLICRKQFEWINLKREGKLITGKGTVSTEKKRYDISLAYSPFLPYRMDRIAITNQKIKFNHDIHVYGDLSLCLYHPIIDRPHFGIIPLHSMIPWISEWCHFYEEWQKYGVWLGKEIKHRSLNQ